jgi:hypothetical protein
VLQPPEEGSKIPSAVRRQDTGDIFPDNPLRPKTASEVKIGKHELTAGVVESGPLSCDAEGLAGGSSHKKVNCSGCEVPGLMFRQVSEVRDGRVVVREHRGRE